MTSRALPLTPCSVDHVDIVLQRPVESFRDDGEVGVTDSSPELLSLGFCYLCKQRDAGQCGKRFDGIEHIVRHLFATAISFSMPSSSSTIVSKGLTLACA